MQIYKALEKKAFTSSRGRRQKQVRRQSPMDASIIMRLFCNFISKQVSNDICTRRGTRRNATSAPDGSYIWLR